MSRAQGIHGSGSRDYSPGDEFRIRTALQASAGYLTVAQLVFLTGCEGRTVREVLSQIDGTDLVLAGGDEGYKIARTVEEAEPMTRRLESQARKMMERATRRRNQSSLLVREQGGLW